MDLLLRTDANLKRLGVYILKYCENHPVGTRSDFINMLHVICMKKDFVIHFNFLIHVSTILAFFSKGNDNPT